MRSRKPSKTSLDSSSYIAGTEAPQPSSLITSLTNSWKTSTLIDSILKLYHSDYELVLLYLKRLIGLEEWDEMKLKYLVIQALQSFEKPFKVVSFYLVLLFWQVSEFDFHFSHILVIRDIKVDCLRYLLVCLPEEVECQLLSRKLVLLSDLIYESLDILLLVHH